ncbi:disease resistance protein RPS2-like [Impatiens glandulifera]|uniref:disease resistance protein RPS2-like n=1 Tax=Impatiens glandulifera TaxID=253017 RepID=UPI001FB0ED31|nr:disease resistance protein RPS2-like [Impatiens glandulifera]
MEETVALCVGGKIGELLIKPIQRELGYFFSFNSNIQELETRLDELKATRNDIQRMEDAEKKMGKTLGDRAQLWIEKADGKIVEAESVLNEKAQLQKGCFSIKWCPNLILRFSLGRKGKKSSLVLIELLQSGGQLPHTGQALPMPSINMRYYNGDARDFESRSQIMKNIVEMLRDDETMLIGICGMGGIGKTTLAKQILQEVKDSHKHLFDVQVISIVSSSPNFNVIQQEVAEMLGSSLKDLEGKTLRAERLRNTFNNKKVVVVLDDVWEEFDLNAFGFPITKSDAVGCCCKIIYTSRIQGLWSAERIITKQEFSLDVLSSEEAWNFFTIKVDLQVVDIDFHWKNKIAKEIVKECGRLPLALGVVGGALIGKDKHEWKNMLLQLRNQGLDQHTDKINKVLETSYHFLKDLNAQFLFLLCCLFGEDEIISIETLYRYAVGLQHFKGINNLQRIRVHVYTLVDNLIRRNLLIKFEERYPGELHAVKMHDLIRDVGISIAEQEKKGIHFLKYDGVNQLENVVTPHTKMISILLQNNNLEVLDSMGFRGSKLEILRLDNSYYYHPNIKVSGNYLFQGANNLKVLDINGFHSVISEFPYSSSLAKLKMLSLDGLSLDMATNVSSIGYMKCLEVLSLRSSSIKDLPNEISELTNLKLLDLTKCKCFIINGVLSKLTNLQELYMWKSFKDWKLQNEDVNDGDNHAAGLDELNCLHKLWRLELKVPNIEQVPRGVRLFSSSTLLEQFKIRIGGAREYSEYSEYESEERRLWLENVRNNTSLIHELGVLIEKDITHLYLCADSVMWEKTHINKFLSLKDIVLKQCGSLFPQSPSSVQTSELGRCLRRIELYKCNQMRHLCSTSISKNLTNLKVLVLEECEMMEEVVSFQDDKEQLNKIEFNVLETLKLCDLSRLECFCKVINVIHFHKLKTLELNDLKKFIFPTKLEIPYLEELSMTSILNIETLCLPPSLQKLNIDRCDNFQYIDFSNNMVSNSMVMKVISNLRNLTIRKCKMLNGVVGVTMGVGEQQRKSIEFPNLLTLYLESLDEFTSFVITVNNLGDKEEKSRNALFYHNDYQVMFPSLHELEISALPKINYIIGRNSEQVRVHDDIEEWHGRELLVFPNMETLRLKHLKELVSFVGVMNNIDNNCKNQNALFHPDDDDEVSFPSLQKLSVYRLPKINYIVERKTGQVRRRRDDEGYGKEIQQPILLLFLNLKTLELDHLEELVSFVGVMNNMDNILFCMQVSFPSLEELTIEELTKINYIVGWKEGEGHHHHHDKIFPVLSELRLNNLSNLIHVYEINQPGLGVLLFQNLTLLTVDGCGKLRYLFSENIGRVAAKHLVSISIYKCGMMEVVMKNIEEEDLIIIIEDDVKEGGGSNSLGHTHFLPLLERLYLMELSSLRIFSDVAYTWALPSLSSLEVLRCPKLEALSTGYLEYSPRMDHLYYGHNYREEVKVNVKDTWKGDVNKALRHLFIKKQEEPVERLENMDEESEDDEEE